jgi:enoyl-CoA hydratase/carnithine racemase
MAQVEVERDGAVMVLTLNRPKRKNAMTLTMFALLADAWAELSADDALSCAIPDGRFRGSAAAPDPVHRRRRHPAHW